MCGGSIISPSKILSAAHCFTALTQSPHLVKFVRARVGSSRHNDGGSVRDVARVVSHPDFNKPSRLNNDVAIVILKIKLDYGPKIKAIELPRSGSKVPADIKLRVSGWGRTKNTPNSPPATKLNFVTVNSIAQKLCEDAFKNVDKYKFTDKMFCAGILKVGGKDACQGDSGGLNSNW